MTEGTVDPEIQRRFVEVTEVYDARTTNAEVHDCREASCVVDPKGGTGPLFVPQKRPPLDPGIVALAKAQGV